MSAPKFYYKALGKNRTCFHSGKGTWLKPPQWMPKLPGELVPCQYGYHILKRDQLIYWLSPEIWTVEVLHSNKSNFWEENRKCVTTNSCRLVKKFETWNEMTARLFAADCAEEVLPIFESFYSGNYGPRKAIELARLFARGKTNADATKAIAESVRNFLNKNSCTNPHINSALIAAEAALNALDTTWAIPALSAVTAAVAARIASPSIIARESIEKRQTKILFEYLEGIRK